MFASKTILILEENAYSALDIASAIEERDGTIAGPVASTADALALIDETPFSGAIIDADVSGVSQLVDRLEEKKVPLILQAASRLTPACGKTAVMLYRPIDMTMLVSMLAIAIDSAQVA